MVLTGVAMITTGLQFANSALLYTIGLACDAIILAPFAQLVMAFPSGRLEGRASRIGVGLVWACGLLQVPMMMFMQDASCPSCPDDLLLIKDSNVLGDIVGNLQALCLLGGVATCVTVLIRRWRRASRL